MSQSMTLELSLPALLTRINPEVELRPAHVERWLADLPLLNVAETGQRLLTALSAYNRITIAPDTRLALLELYRVAARQVAIELQKRYLGLPLPLPDKARSVAEAVRQLQTELAYGYKHVVVANGTGAASTLRTDQRQQVATPIQRALRYLTEILFNSYTAYSAYPPGTWREIHALYHHAEQLGLTDVAVPDALNSTRPTQSIADAYKHALLLDFSDPYHLPARLTARCDLYLDRYAGAAQLAPVPAQYDPTCQFVIDIDADRAGVPYLEEAAVAPAERFRLLNTIDLARQIHAHLTQLQQGRNPEPDGLPEEFYSDGAGELLRRLILAWGIHPHRMYRRNARAESDVDVAVGLDACHYWLHGTQPFVRSSNFVGPLPDRGQLSGIPPATPSAPATPSYPHETWRLEDESAGGMALTKTGLVRAPIRVGDLVAIRFADDAEWGLAAVRWARSANPSDVEVGIQRLAPSAQAVMIQPEDGPGAKAFVPALRLPAIPALDQLGGLVVPRGMYRPERIFYVDDGFRLYRIRGTQLVELTNAFERFQYTEDEA